MTEPLYISIPTDLWVTVKEDDVIRGVYIDRDTAYTVADFYGYTVIRYEKVEEE